MAVTLKIIHTTLIFFIIIIKISGLDSNDTSPDGDRRSGARGRIIKSYSGEKSEPILCTGEGFLPDPHNCATFYRCVTSGRDKFTIFRFQCGPGTVYDPDNQVCNHPQYVKRSECGGILTPSVETTHINEIQESMYNEIPSPMATSKPIYPSNTLHTSTIVNVKPTPPSYAVNFTTKPYIPTTPVISYPDYNMKPLNTVTTSHPNSRDNMCMADGFMGDSEDCRKFYRCVANQIGGFTRYEFMCSDPTVWDDSLQICNHAWAVKRSRCSFHSNELTNSNTEFTHEKLQTEKNRNKPLVTEKNNTVQQQLQVGYGTKVIQTQTQIGNGLVKQNQTQINYGDRLDQSKGQGSKQDQTQISHGSAISQSQTQIDYGDKGVQTQLQIDHSKEASQNQIQIIETSSKKSTTTMGYPPQEINEPESTKCIKVGFIGDNNDCRKFYRCVKDGEGGFKKIGSSCPENTAWDPDIKNCNHIWKVKGCHLQGPMESSPHTITTTIYKTTQSYYSTNPIEYATSQVPERNEDSEDTGYKYPKPEPVPTPSSSESTPTTIHNSNGLECKSSGFMGDSNDCKIFYRCVENGNGGFAKYAFKCGDGTLWDPDIKACNHEWAVTKCGGNISSDINKVEVTSEKLTTSSPIYIQNNIPTVLPTESSLDYDNNDLPGYELPSNDIQTTTRFNEISLESTKHTTTSTTESISIGHECTQGGFIGDSSDCKRFYRCVDDGNGSFIKYEFLCAEGTLWDDKIKSCNHAWAVTRCSSNVESPPSDDDFNHNYPSNENTDSEISDTTVTFSTSSVTTTPQTSSEICVSDGFFGDSKDCKKFYRCVDDGKGSFIRYEYVCGEGTVWDSSLKVCNHYWAVKECGNTENSTVNKVNESNTEYSEISTTSPKYEEASSVINDSSIICSKEDFIADPNNCKLFYRCVNDGQGGLTKYQYSCGEGTYWNQEILSCDHVTDNNTCQSGSISTTTEKYNTSTTSVTKPVINYEDLQTTENDKPSTTEQLPGDKIDEENVNSHFESPPTSSDCLSEGYYPNENDCRKFYRCVDNGKGSYTKYDHTCSEGTAWDSDIQTCNYIDLVLSCKESVTYEEDKTQTTENVGSTTQRVTSSITTGKTSSTTQKSISNTEHFSADSHTQNTDACASEGFFGNTQDCKKFYRCVNDGKGGYTKFDFVCGEGTIWDQDVLTCNHPENVAKPSCNQTQGSTPTDDSSLSGSTATTTENNQGQSKPSTKPEHSYFNCTTAGFYADPNNCKKFYRCVDWDGNGTKFSVFHFECGEGTIWDPAVETCNHEDSVYPPRDCNGDQTTVTEITTTTEEEEQSTTTSTTQSTTSSTTLSTTKSTTLSTTKSTTESITTESTTQTIPEQPDGSTTEESGQSTTQQIHESTTEYSATSTTEPLEENTTEQSTESTIEQSTVSTTEQSTESPTEQSTASTTEQSTESTTEQSRESTTDQSTESTTEQSTKSTSEQSTESTTEQSTKSTTEQSTESTTEQSTKSTTEQSTEITTEQSGESTTEQSVASTTEQSQESTTPLLVESTTDQSTASTTDQSTTNTTEESTDSTNPDRTTTEDSVTIETQTESPTEKPTDSNCPEVGEDQYLFVCPTSFKRHPKYCNLFYQCDENENNHDLKVAVFTCPDNTIYDENQTKCVRESKAEKPCRGQITEKRRVKRKEKTGPSDPIIASEKSYGCTTTGYFSFEKGDCSPGFLKCTSTQSKKLRGLVYQCPPGYLFWTVSKRCEPMNKISDCKRSPLNDWSKRWQIPIERKNVAW